ncbi:MAG: DNRLRE domain-containing protein [Verrucomicrobiota bacterium]
MNTESKDRLLELAHAQIEEQIGDEEIQELESLLDASPEARRIYTDFMHDHASLHWEHVANSSGDNITDLSDWRPSRLPSLPQTLVAAAIISLLALVIVRPSSAPPTFATMEATEAASWQSGSLPTADGSRLGKGNLNLAEGLATVIFDSGATVILEGPAQLEIEDAMNCILRSGTAVAEVEESAQGFRIETPRANVIDHGTRFAVNVDPVSGATMTQVFDGLVEVELATTQESIELKGGERTFVAGENLGDIDSGAEELTRNEATSGSAFGDGWIKLSTDAGSGTDGYVWGGTPNDHVSDELLLIKNGTGAQAPHRKAYLRFDLTQLPSRRIAEAQLHLQFTPTGWGLASMVDDSVFEVLGIVDDSLDQWAYPSMNWANAPASDTASGDRMDPDKTVSLGTFTVPRGVQRGSFHLSGEPLREFLKHDQNRLATLVVVRKTVENNRGGLVHAFASKRHPTLPAPMLSVKLK